MAKPLWLAMGGMLLLAPAVPYCQGYPSKPIRIVVPFVPGGNIDMEAVQKLRNAVDAVIAQPRTREAFEKFGAEVVPNSAEEFTRRLQQDYARWMRIRKQTGIKID